MRRSTILSLAIGCAVAGALGAGLFASGVLRPISSATPPRNPAWTEVAWPFPVDQFGRGKAYHCAAKHCGTDVKLYVRAKIGFCDCVSTIEDDEVDRVGDIDLIGGERAALGPGRPIAVRWMKGRSRGYALGAGGSAGKSALSIAFHDRCDMIIATAAVAASRPSMQEDAVIEFLNSDRILRWAEVTLGL